MISAYAEVDQSNALVLGSVNGVNGATALQLVGSSVASEDVDVAAHVLLRRAARAVVPDQGSRDAGASGVHGMRESLTAFHLLASHLLASVWLLDIPWGSIQNLAYPRILLTKRCGGHMRTIAYSAAKADLFMPSERGRYFSNNEAQRTPSLCAELSRLASCRKAEGFSFDSDQIQSVLQAIGFSNCDFIQSAAAAVRAELIALQQSDGTWNREQSFG